MNPKQIILLREFIVLTISYIIIIIIILTANIHSTGKFIALFGCYTYMIFVLMFLSLPLKLKEVI